MILNIIKTYREVKSGIKNPTGFGKGALLDVIKAPLIVFTLAGLLVLGIVFLFGFTELIVDQWVVFKIIFFILLVPFLIIELVVWSIYRKIKTLAEQAKKRADEKLGIIDTEVQ